MGSFTLSWRPSGGRGEYEYASKEHDAVGKQLILHVPFYDVRINSEVKCEVHDGKPRLRRNNPNDRSTLNLPNLVVAAAIFPDPIRQDKTGAVKHPLKEKGYVIHRLLFDVIEDEDGVLVIEPKTLEVLHDEQVIDLNARIGKVFAQSNDSTLPKDLRDNLSTHRSLLLSGTNSIDLKKATAAIIDTGAKLSGDVSDATPLEMIDARRTVEAPLGSEDFENYVGREGKSKIVSHKKKERDPRLSLAAKALFKGKYGKLFCEACGFDFATIYPGIGDDFIEAHHKVPLSTLLPDSITTPKDLAMLCSNCHRMVHRASQELSVFDIRQKLTETGSVQNQANLELLD